MEEKTLRSSRSWLACLRLVLAISFLGLLAACGESGDPAPTGEPWRLNLHDPGSQATLEISPDDPERFRVEISSANVPVPFNVQVNRAGLSVEVGVSYRVSFRARADQTREFGVGVSMAHAPWQGLGFYRLVTATPEWQDYAWNFEANSTDDLGRIHFDLGASAISVEIEHVVFELDVAAVE